MLEYEWEALGEMQEGEGLPGPKSEADRVLERLREALPAVQAGGDPASWPLVPRFYLRMMVNILKSRDVKLSKFTKKRLEQRIVAITSPRRGPKLRHWTQRLEGARRREREYPANLRRMLKYRKSYKGTWGKWKRRCQARGIKWNLSVAEWVYLLNALPKVRVNGEDKELKTLLGRGVSVIRLDKSIKEYNIDNIGILYKDTIYTI